MTRSDYRVEPGWPALGAGAGLSSSAFSSSSSSASALNADAGTVGDAQLGLPPLYLPYKSTMLVSVAVPAN